jgi:hypothetical protein
MFMGMGVRRVALAPALGPDIYSRGFLSVYIDIDTIDLPQSPAENACSRANQNLGKGDIRLLRIDLLRS